MMGPCSANQFLENPNMLTNAISIKMQKSQQNKVEILSVEIIQS